MKNSLKKSAAAQVRTLLIVPIPIAEDDLQQLTIPYVPIADLIGASKWHNNLMPTAVTVPSNR